MLSTLAYFELLTLTDGSYRRRCCVRRIILTRTLAFGRRRCRPLQQRCCRSNTRRFHRQDRRKSTLECRQEEKAFPKTPAKNEPKAEIGLVFISSCFSPRFLKPGFVKTGSYSVRPKFKIRASRKQKFSTQKQKNITGLTRTL